MLLAAAFENHRVDIRETRDAFSRPYRPIASVRCAASADPGAEVSGRRRRSTRAPCYLERGGRVSNNTNTAGRPLIQAGERTKRAREQSAKSIDVNSDELREL